MNRRGNLHPVFKPGRRFSLPVLFSRRPLFLFSDPEDAPLAFDADPERKIQGNASTVGPAGQNQNRFDMAITDAVSPWGRAFQEAFDDASLDGLMQSKKIRKGKRDLLAPRGNPPAADDLPDDAPEIIIFPTDDPGGLTEPADQLRVVVRHQLRNQLVPDPVAEKKGALVGAVRHVREPFAPEEFEDSGSSDVQQGADDPAVPHRQYPSETHRSASPEQVVQDGLRLIVTVMTDGNFHGPALLGRLMEKPVALLPADLLQRPPLPFLQRTNIHLFADTGDPHPGAETTNERLIPIRFLFP